MTSFGIMRKIEIDAAHRIPEHGSACRNLHGHRYTIEAHCSGILGEGESSGITLDFKFLKEEMMHAIHDPCDHGMILRYDDWLLKALAPDIADEAADAISKGLGHFYSTSHWNKGLKLCVLPFVPTAENLAKFWFELLVPNVIHRSDERAILEKIVVHETPNCLAVYPFR